MEDNVIVVDNTDEFEGRLHHRRHHRSSRHGSNHHGSSHHSHKKIISHKWKRFCKKVFKIESKREISVMIVIVFLMAIIVPVVIAILDAINRFFNSGI